MPGSSILPVALNQHDGKLYFLFGKENPMEDSSHGFSDFGGGVDKGENVYQTALREGSEELTGFLGNSSQLGKMIKRNGGVMKLVYRSTDKTGKENTYTVHIFNMPYDADLPNYYNMNHEFLWNKMNKRMLNNTKLFEKINIKWTCEDDLLKCPGEYRHFYVDIVKMLVEEKEKIRVFIESKMVRKDERKSGRKTRGLRRLRRRGKKTMKGG